MEEDSKINKPGLLAKVVSASTYAFGTGMLVTIASLLAELVTPKGQGPNKWAFQKALEKWSNKGINLGLVGGFVYGWNKPEQEYLKQQNQKLQIQTAVLESKVEIPQLASATKSWTAAEDARASIPAPTEQTR